MALSVDRINTELNSYTRRLNFDQIPQAQLQSQFTQLSSEMSQLGTQVGQVLGGFQSLTQELDVPPEVLNSTLANQRAATANFTDGTAFSLPEELSNVSGVVNRGIVMLAENPPNISIQNNPSSLNSDLQAITESPVGGGFNNLVITANTPEAMAQTMTNVAGVPLTQAQAAVGTIVPQIPALLNNVGTVLGNLQNNLPVINTLSREVNSFFNNVNRALNVTSSARGLLNDVVETLTGSVKNDIRSLLSIESNVPTSVLEEATQFVQAGQHDLAVNILQPYSNFSADELLVRLQQIDTSLSRDVTSTTASSNEPTPGISSTQRPEQPDQPITETGVIYGLISSVDRDITELVFKTVSISAPTNAIQPADYPNWHMLVQTDGTINRSAALSTQLDVTGHEQYSLGIVVAAKNNRITADQTSAIDRIMRAFFSLIPYGQIINFSEINAQVRSEVIYDFAEHATEHFNYRSVMSDNVISLSTEQIQLRIRAAATSGSPHIDDSV